VQFTAAAVPAPRCLQTIAMRSCSRIGVTHTLQVNTAAWSQVGVDTR
jgi:hypothetical protein